MTISLKAEAYGQTVAKRKKRQIDRQSFSQYGQTRDSKKQKILESKRSSYKKVLNKLEFWPDLGLGSIWTNLGKIRILANLDQN